MEGTEGGHSSDSPDELLETLTQDLRHLVTLGADPAEIVRNRNSLPSLTSLSMVRSPADTTGSGVDTGIAVTTALRQVIDEVSDSATRQGYIELFGLDGRAHHSPDRRRESAMRRLVDNPGMLVDSFRRRHEVKYCRTLAHLLVKLDRQHELNAAHPLLQQGSLDSGDHRALVWLDRFEYYFRVWSPASGIGSDLQAYLVRRHQDPDDPGLPAYLDSLSYFVGYYSFEIQRFVVDRGGLWILSTPDNSERVSQLVYDIAWHLPLGQTQITELTQIYASGGVVPTVDFVAYELDRSGDRAEIQERWRGFLAECACDLQQPSDHCQPHHVISLVQEYMDLVNTEYYLVAPWYQAGPAQLEAAFDSLREKYQTYSYRFGESASDSSDP